VLLKMSALTSILATTLYDSITVRRPRFNALTRFGQDIVSAVHETRDITGVMDCCAKKFGIYFICGKYIIPKHVWTEATGIDETLLNVLYINLDSGKMLCIDDMICISV
jgi:hypothetical protein